MEEEKIEQKPTQPEPKNSMFKSKWLLILGVVILILLIAGGAYYLGTQKTTPAVTSSSVVTPTQTAVATSTPIPSPTTAEMKKFTSAKFDGLSFSGYSLMYPADWTLSEQRDNSVPISTVTLTKQGYSLKIFQAATGGAQCVYEGAMPEGPASDYRTNKFTDLVTSFATLRQTESPANGKMAYVYCQKNADDGSFGQPTNVGHMSVTTGVSNPDEKIISEIEQIVKSIKTLP